MKPLVDLYKLGRMRYNDVLHVQQVLFDKLKAFGVGKNSLILVEHEPVYTIGIRSREYDDNYVSRLKRKLTEHKLEADFVRTNRGGLVTFHGPGQLVAYPIIYLGDFNKTIPRKSVKSYVSLLETTIIDTLARVGLEKAHTVQEYPGVWLDNGERKVAFIGISCKRYVTMHGISINCDCDLSWFDHIVSCGIEDKSITSVHQEILTKVTGEFRDVSPPDFNADLIKNENQNLARTDVVKIPHKFDVEYVSRAFCQSFSNNFQCELLDRPIPHFSAQ